MELPSIKDFANKAMFPYYVIYILVLGVAFLYTEKEKKDADCKTERTEYEERLKACQAETSEADRLLTAYLIKQDSINRAVDAQIKRKTRR